MEDLNRFWSKVQKTDTCWIWTRCKDTAGYGLHNINNKRTNQKAHRVSWEIHFGPIPSKLYVLHKCDIRACVNPDHLFLGTHEDNMADMAKKNRAYRPLGGKPGAAILTISQVLEIRRLCAQGIPQRKIAKMFGVTQPNVGAIKLRKTWRHI